MSARSTCQAVDPSTGRTLDTSFPLADLTAVQAACARAEADFDAWRELPMERRALLLEIIAGNILDLGPALLEQAAAETGLPLGRLEGERGRTVAQLRFFAGMVRRGEVLDVRIDPAQPERLPLAKPDLRLRHIPVGPVAVFGASNFPLAFSVAGGDTASALAAGCPVIVKGHPAHPATGALAAAAVQAAVVAVGAPAGAFAYLLGDRAVGAALVADPRIKAVGFTGSRQGGLALQAIAAGRPEPIPVFAEMSSVNPVVLAPEALKARTQALAEGFVASLALGAGQFCTNPGIVLALDGPDLDRFIDIAAALVACQPSQVMLTPGIHLAYESGVRALRGHADAALVAEGLGGEGPNRGRAALFATDAARFMADSRFQDEVFGAAAIVVRCDGQDQLMQVLAALVGQLTATLHIDSADEAFARRLLPLMERKAGRILANGWPTGVEVSPAMVHGGPFPATSDSRSTSVGGLAIRRFLRPVCYQDLPAALLPEGLRPT